MAMKSSSLSSNLQQFPEKCVDEKVHDLRSTIANNQAKGVSTLLLLCAFSEEDSKEYQNQSAIRAPACMTISPPT